MHVCLPWCRNVTAIVFLRVVLPLRVQAR